MLPVSFGSCSAVNAVSYTHLDVYKRQFVDNSQNIFKVDDIETYLAIKRMLENEKMTVRMRCV